jgi:hypothetical protein
LLAEYLNSDDEKKKKCVEKLESWLSDPVYQSDQTLLVIAATIYNYEENYLNAIKCVHEPTNLEMYFYSV